MEVNARPEHFAKVLGISILGQHFAEILPIRAILLNMEQPPIDLELKRKVDELIALKGGTYNPDLVQDIILSAPINYVQVFLYTKTHFYPAVGCPGAVPGRIRHNG